MFKLKIKNRVGVEEINISCPAYLVGFILLIMILPISVFLYNLEFQQILNIFEQLKQLKG